MEEAPENGKESPHSVHANGLIGLIDCLISMAAIRQHARLNLRTGI